MSIQKTPRDTSSNFAQILFKTVPKSDLEELGEREKAGIVSAHQTLCQSRKPGKPVLLIGKTTCDDPANDRTTIDIINDDRPFLVDSIVAEINRHKLLIDFLIHPFSHAEFEGKGAICNISSEKTAKSVKQSHLHIRLHRLIPSTLAAEITDGILGVIADVILATSDWEKMRKQTADICETLLEAANSKVRQVDDLKEYAAFLSYVHNDNFTLLGYRRYVFSGKDKMPAVDHAHGLGLLNKTRKHDFLDGFGDDIPPMLQRFAKNPKPLHVLKINRDSTVHRRVPIDCIAVKMFDTKGELIGFHILIGLFTSVTYSRSVTDIPYLRMKVGEIINQADFSSGSHDDKALRHILEKYPRDELFQTDVKQLREIALSVLSLQERQRIALFLRPDPFERSVSCLIYIPRERYDTNLRKRFEKILEEEIGGRTSAFYTTLDDSVFARVILIIETNNTKVGKVDHDKLENMLQEAGRAWDELLSAALNSKFGTDAEKYIETYSNAFPIGYRERYKVAAAIYDIDKLERLTDDNPVEFDLYRPSHYQGRSLRLKMYVKDQPVVLSDVLPILEKLGLRVIAELPYEVKPQKDKVETYWVHDFLMENQMKGEAIDIVATKRDFEETIRRVWLKKMKNGSLNRLVLTAGMDWREVLILRTYVYFIRQLNLPYSQVYVSQALCENPHIARLLSDLFCTMHHPAANAKRDETTAQIRQDILAALEHVESLDQDKILRCMLTLLDHTLRTNFFQTDKSGNLKDYLSIKIDSAAIPEIPAPKPYREIFVYSPRTEGIHLRGGPIARGGIRWSDRQEDYRTEVLGLMKAQMVKNAVIVPVGAKGGFILKQPPKDGGRAALQAEAIECYKIFIRGLLDITDNRKGTKVIAPHLVHRRDGDDPYLVVAADKGTATFSDTANALSLEYDFWLGDAFASGGSAGYDHKKMGITARGGWESVKRHFAELNHDIQTQDFDVIGVGDMAGDVFGNGMLLSRHIRLIGAFNHVHIFCDPNPDTELSFNERERLFKEMKGWDEYDTSKLSAGARIYSRSEKKLKLTPEIKKSLGITEDTVSPFELMRAMLLAKADMIWFGGIGTYIKSGSETNADVGDKSNDLVRVNAKDIHAKVIGEGANLAITQLGRIEFAQAGGRINADFIDNSGGVDSSDHEVNIKILMKAIMEDKDSKMDTKARNKLLESMTSDVAAHVLAHNFQQAQAISLMEFQANENLGSHADFISDLERVHNLNRKLEGLPDQEDISHRLRAGKGLTRPELSILQAYAKMTLTNSLLDSKIPDDPQTQSWLFDYFPAALRKKYAAQIEKHRLKREIIATMMAGQIVNRMGPVFVKQRMDKTGAIASDVCRAWLIAVRIFKLDELWNAIESSDHKALAFVRLRALKETAILANRITTWFLNQHGHNLDIAKCCEAFAPRVEKLQGMLSTLLPQQMQENATTQKNAYSSDGLPVALAEALSIMPYLASTCDIVNTALSRKSKNDLALIGQIYYELGQEFRLNWLRQKAIYMTSDDHWMDEARDGLIEQLYEVQGGITRAVLRDATGTDGHEIVEKWIAQHRREIDKLAPLFEEFRREGHFDLSKLSLAEQRLRHLYHG